MRRFYTISIVTLLVTTLASACAPKPVVPAAPTDAPASTSAPASTVAPTIGSEPTLEATKVSESPKPVLAEFDPINFEHSTIIDNEWHPMQPGMYWNYEGTAVEDGKDVSRRIEFTVTDLTKEINGVHTVVGWIEDFTDGELTEKEIAFYAQDNDGNVWYLGEHPEEIENGEFVKAPTWIAGVEDARAGIKMMAEPQLGPPSLYQGWGPAVEWTDYGQVDQVGQKICVPVDCYTDVLVIAESSLGEANAFQLKYYARGVGNIQVGWRGADESQEELVLTEYMQLSPAALAEVRVQVLDLEKHAYQISKDVYGKTAPMESIPPAEYTLEATTGGETAEPQFADFDPGNFDNPIVIDNEWMPMQPGTKWAYEGTALDDEGNSVNRRIEFTVTDLTKEIAGVRTVVGWIVDYNDEEVIEKEIAFYAQDNDGNVWYLGEYPEEYEGGEFVKAAPWITGIEDARAGIKMMAKPQLGGPKVYQGWAPAVEWSDYGQVDQMGQKTCVPVDCYEDVLVNAESSLGEEGAFQLKYYARGVGEVRVGWKGADETKEELELVEYMQLSPEELGQVRAEALEVEKHAYETSKDVYGQTAPME